MQPDWLGPKGGSLIKDGGNLESSPLTICFCGISEYGRSAFVWHSNPPSLFRQSKQLVMMSASKTFNCNCRVFVGLCEWEYVCEVNVHLTYSMSSLSLGWWCVQFGGHSHLWAVESEWFWARDPEDSTHKDWASWAIWGTVEQASFRNHWKRIEESWRVDHWVLDHALSSPKRTECQLEARQMVAHLLAVSIIVMETSLAFGFWSLLAEWDAGSRDHIRSTGIHCSKII